MIVSKYEVTRHYGGPEEGGWWYDRWEFIDVLAENLPYIVARAKAHEFNEQAKAEKRQPSKLYQGRFSMANHTDDIYVAEEYPAQKQQYVNDRPRYE